jgi:electron transfer flavoprotein alpha subunit
MDVIVLVKYVADIEHVPNDAWDMETGTLRRGKLHMIANPLDDRALAAGTRIAHARGSDARGTDGRLCVISMGPRSAESICRRAVAFGADHTVLLTHRDFAGSDTLATAQALAQAVRYAEREHGLSDPLIFAGMQSPDGDTAHVPAELASILDLPFVPYVIDLAASPRELAFTVMTRVGHATVTLPAGALVATFTGFAAAPPFHTTIHGFLRATRAGVQRLGPSDLGLDAERVGLDGSATQVRRIEQVAHGRSSALTVDLSTATDPAREVADLARLAFGAVGRVGRGADAGRGASTQLFPAGRRGSVGRDVMVYVEIDEGRAASGSLELLSAARELADQIGSETVALVCGGRVDVRLARSLARAGANRIVEATPGRAVPDAPTPRAADALREVQPHRFEAHMIAQAVRLRSPRTVLIPATLFGRAVSALAAAELGAGLTADCTDLRLEPAQPDGETAAGASDGRTRPEGQAAAGASHGPAQPDRRTRPRDPAPRDERRLLQVRPALGGNILATIVSTVPFERAPEMATVRAGVFTARDYGGPAVPVARITVDVGSLAVRLHRLVAGGASRIDHDARTNAADVPGVQTDADIVVAVGAGAGSRANVERYVNPLVAALAERLGLTVSLACSRAAVDAGILPYPYQVGQTGKTVRPELYVALGISGAIQHRLGMERSARILAVNPDDEAPIHRVSDYSIVGSLEAIVPLLVDALARS